MLPSIQRDPPGTGQLPAGSPQMVPADSAPERDLNVVIIGLGLMGGSAARAIRSRWPRLRYLTAMDTGSAVLQEALGTGTADEIHLLPTTACFDPPARAALASADLILVATPVDVLAETIRAAAAVSGALITDLGSVKQAVLRAAGAGRIVGGHPMAGSERRGFACSSASLFENAVYVLCPSPAYTGGDLDADLALLTDLIAAVGARPKQMAPAAHDAAVSAISHLPHVVAAALVNAVVSDESDLVELAAGGFRDITRIASSDSSLWTGIVRESKADLLPALERFEAQLAAFRMALVTDDAEALAGLFEMASGRRGALPAQGGGALAAEALIQIELQDRPGEIAVVSTLLAVRGINIKNIGMVHARQYEGGRIQLYLSSGNQAAAALDILRGAGYECC